MLLLNGASGIAAGMATNIPPHNLGELCDAITALVDNPDLAEEDLVKIVPAPDFPTGGNIMGTAGSEDLYKTGRGSIVMRAKTHIESLSRSTGPGGRSTTRNAIVVTELPYLTNKSGLLEKIADLVNEKKLEGITDLRDESDRHGIRVVIELKRDAIPAVVQNNLFKKTALQTTFSGNMLALVDEGKQPQRLNLRGALNIFIKFRFKTLRRRTKHKLEKLKARDHIVQGLIAALKRVDDIIALLRKCKDTASARAVLVGTEYGFSAEQAESILGLRLSRLTAMEEGKLSDEHETLSRDILVLEELMHQDDKVNEMIKQETLDIKNKFGQPRRSEILDAEGVLSDQDLLANDRSVIIITKSGYIKRLPIEEFESQSRGTKGKAGAKMSGADDGIVHFFSCNDHDSVLFVTDKGIAYSIKAFQVPLGSRIAKGVPLPQILPFSAQERVTSVIPIETFDREDEHLVLLTKFGFVKKTPLKSFKNISARGLIIISLTEGDSLGWSRRCLPHEEVLIATKDGFACRFSVSDLSSTGRQARGVRALNLREADQMADIDINTRVKTLLDGSPNPEYTNDKSAYVFAITERGYGKRIPISEFRKAKRGGRGVFAIKFKEKAGGGGKQARQAGRSKEESDALRCFRFCAAGDEVVLSTSKGTILRQKVDDVSVQARSATGVLVQKLDKGDAIMDIAIVREDAGGNQ